MPNLLLVLFALFIVFFLIYFLFNSKKSCNRTTKNSYSQLKSISNEQEYNPDINIHNWDLHKIRLNKFGRSQYKGLTFFKSSEGRIYYLSEKGTKVYC